MQKSPLIIKTILFLVFIISACNDKPIIPEPLEGITKGDREQLGDILLEEIYEHPLEFPLLPNEGNDTIVYHFVQTLYNQATSLLKLDLETSGNNRWNRDREWSVFILKEDSKQEAFILPGGVLFLSTGFLKSMKREHELFYVLAFEASLMHEKYLLNQLIANYNSLNLSAIIEGAAESNGITAERIISDVRHFIFDPSITAEVDGFAVNVICETSIYKPDGIIDILNDISDSDAQWLKKRETYNEREFRILELSNQNGTCGDLRTNGVYEERVLNVLN